MAPPEDNGEEDARRGGPSQPAEPPRYGRYVGLLAIVLLLFITLNTLLTKPNGVAGVSAGEAVPPFAVPLAVGTLKGDANVAVSGPHPACSVRKPGVLNICALYEQGPVVVAMFIDGQSCPNVLSEMQALVPEFPSVRFAAVSIKGNRASIARIVAKRRLSFPVGWDDQGDLAALYRMATCPQVTFVLPGGRVESKALLNVPSLATLRARVGELAAAAAPAPGASTTGTTGAGGG